MELTVNGHRTFCYTGGRTFDPALPTVVFLHGVLNDHSVWILQTRWFAHHGWNVLAPDLPGHCRSEGEAPRSVDEAAAFVVALLDAFASGIPGEGSWHLANHDVAASRTSGSAACLRSGRAGLSARDESGGGRR